MHLIQIVPNLILLKQLFRRSFYTVDQMRPYYRILRFSDTNCCVLNDVNKTLSILLTGGRMEIWDYLILFWYHCQRPKVIYLQIRIKLTPGAVFASFQFCFDSPRNSIEVNLL